MAPELVERISGLLEKTISQGKSMLAKQDGGVTANQQASPKPIVQPAKPLPTVETMLQQLEGVLKLLMLPPNGEGLVILASGLAALFVLLGFLRFSF